MSIRIKITVFSQLPTGSSYQKLYDEQNIFFLIWILQQKGCDRFLGEIILTHPFSVERSYEFNAIDINGKDVSKHIIYTYKNDMRHGFVRTWFGINNRIWWQMSWKNGKLHGDEIEWYDSGELRLKTKWQNHKLHGCRQVWHKNGQSMLEDHWYNGVKLGLTKEWNENGQAINDVFTKIAKGLLGIFT